MPEFVVKAIDAAEEAGRDARNEAAGAAGAGASGREDQIEMNQALEQIDEADRQVREIRMFLVQFGLGGALLTLLFLGFYLISVGLRRLSEGGNPRGWLLSGLVLLGLLFLVSVIGTFALMGDPLVDEFRPDRFGGRSSGQLRTHRWPED